MDSFLYTADSAKKNENMGLDNPCDIASNITFVNLTSSNMKVYLPATAGRERGGDISQV